MKKITIISTSLRKNSNSEILANEFMKGAKDSGNEINYINLKNIKMGFCIGCLSCQKTHKCVLKDDITFYKVNKHKKKHTVWYLCDT